MMEHRFEARAADVVGVNAAILLHNMAYWCNHNRQNGINFHDDAYWTYNSNSAFRKQFTYMSRNAIEGAIRKLSDGGYIVIGDYNEDKRDRTRWFTVTEAGYALDRNDECGEVETPRVEKVEEVPKEPKYREEVADVIGYLNSKAGKSFRNVEGNAKHIRARLSEGYTVDDMKRVVDIKCAEWLNSDMAQYLRPSTLFAAGHMDNYLNQQVRGGSRYAEYD